MHCYGCLYCKLQGNSWESSFFSFPCTWWLRPYQSTKNILLQFKSRIFQRLTDSTKKIHATVLTWSGIFFCMQSLVNRNKSWSSLVVFFFMWAALLLHVLEHYNSLWQADVLQRGDGWWVVFAQALSGPMTEILDRLKLFGEFKVLFLFFLVLDLHLP
jgi:hypothetical protein